MEMVSLSDEEKKGIIEMRRRLYDAKKRGDEYVEITWIWHGEELHRFKVSMSILAK